MPDSKFSEALKQAILAIAKKHMGFSTLHTRRADSLDFRDVSVWGARQALIEAFKLGQKHPDIKLEEEDAGN